jgi:hypothetical protein
MTMKARKIIYFLNSFFAGLLLLGVCVTHSGCKDEFTTDSAYRLSMPDSLLFDTILTQTLTPTASFKIYNDTEEDIKIESILLQSEKNFFKININGQSGTSFSNVKIYAKDSMFIFVQFIADRSGSDEPLLIEDKIRFLYNGNVQEIVLSAYGQDVYLMREKVRIQKDTTWGNDLPILIYDSVIVDSAATLTIKEGVTLYMKQKGTFLVNGSLHIEGAAGKDVIFRTERMDNISRNRTYDQANNQWGGIYFSSSSKDNRIDHAFIRGGAFGLHIDSSEVVENEYRLIVANSHIHNTFNACLTAKNANVYAYNSLFTNGANGCVVLVRGYHQFDHCTISYHKAGTGYNNYALRLSNSNFVASSDTYPFRALFNNCIVTGYTSKYHTPGNEIYLVGDSLDYKFDHSLIFTDIPTSEVEQDEKHFNVVICNEDPQYVQVDMDQFNFDFHLSEESPCKEKGDLGLVLRNEAYQVDRDGVARVIEAAPDMGAYQIVVKTEETETKSTDK